MSKKVLILVTKGEVGGAQQSVFNLAQAISQQGMTVTIGFGRGNFLKNKTLNSSLAIKQFKYLKRTHNPLINFLFIVELAKYIKKCGFSIVHFNSSNTLLGALGVKLVNKNIRTIFTFRGLSMLDKNYKPFPVTKTAKCWSRRTKSGNFSHNPEHRAYKLLGSSRLSRDLACVTYQINWLLKYIYKYYFKLFLKFIDKKIFVSQANYQFALNNNISKNGQVIYNGINLDELKFLSKKKARQYLAKKTNQTIKIDDLVIGSIGRLSYQKNYEFLIPLFEQISKQTISKLIIIGDGPKKEECQKLINKYNLTNKVILAGSIDDAYQYLKAFDIFVLCSRYEGQSITLLESMAAGLPILASNIPENKEALGTAGWTFNLKEPNDFIKKINKLLTDPELRQDLQANSLQRAQLFSIDKTILNYLQAYFT